MWLTPHLRPEWAERYGPRADEYHLPHSQQKRLAYALQTGQDGLELMDRIEASPQATLLWQLPAVDILRQIWIQQFRIVDGQLIWRVENQDELPPSAQMINSPYDLQARYSRKHAHAWVGYKVHLSEICDESQPHLITQVATAISTSPDIEALPQIHQGLADKSLLPSQHLVDTGYVSAQMLVESKETYQLDLVGPARQDFKWQARAGEGFAAADFQVDWIAKQATCPQRHLSQSWTPIQQKGQPRVFIKFSRKHCMPCAAGEKCTKMKRRGVRLRGDTQYQALQEARQREIQQTWPFLYSQRAGIEGSAFPGSTRVWHATFALRGSGQDAFAKHLYRHGNQSIPYLLTGSTK